MKHGGKKILIGLACLLLLTWLAGSALATNLVTNGSFELGNTGFSSDYTNDPPGDIYAQGSTLLAAIRAAFIIPGAVLVPRMGIS